MDMDIRQHEQWFAAFTEKYHRVTMTRADAAPIRLKIVHSAAVLANARILAIEEGFATDIARACLLGALYHDVARFPQYLRYRTFKDSLSTNHGLWGARILKKHRRLEGESPRIRALVTTAVALHNRFALPQALRADARLVTDVVRDADKMDIMHIMAAHIEGKAPHNTAVMLHVQDDPSLWSPKVLHDVLHGRVASYGDLTSVNDLRVLMCSWMYDLRFAATRAALLRSGLVPHLLDSLPNAPIFCAVKDHLLQKLHTLST